MSSLPQLAPSPRLAKLTSELHEALDRSAGAVIEAGRLLQEAKDLFAECPALGTFSDWLDREFQWSAVTARRFMRVAERFSHLSETGHSDRFSTSALYLLSSPDVGADALDDALERAASGERISARKAEEIIEEHRSIERALAGMTDEQKLAFIQRAEAEELARQDEREKPTRRQRSTLEKMLDIVKSLRDLHGALRRRKEADRALKEYERVIRLEAD